MRKTSRVRLTTLLAGALAGLFLVVQAGPASAARPAGKIGVDWGTAKGQECVDCHMTENPGLYWAWNHSQHGQHGVQQRDHPENHRA